MVINQRGRGFVVDSGTVVAHLRAKVYFFVGFPFFFPDFFGVFSAQNIAHVLPKTLAEKEKWIKALAEVKQNLSTISKCEEKGEKHDDTASMVSIGPTVINPVEDPLAKMKDYLSKVQKIKDNLTTHLGQNFDGVLEYVVLQKKCDFYNFFSGGKSAKKDVVKDAAPHLQELFSTISNLEEEVDIVTTSLMEQLEALKEPKSDTPFKPVYEESGETTNSTGLPFLFASLSLPLFP